MLNLESIKPKEMEAIYIVIIIINAIHKANEALDKTQKNKDGETEKNGGHLTLKHSKSTRKEYMTDEMLDDKKCRR